MARDVSQVAGRQHALTGEPLTATPQRTVLMMTCAVDLRSTEAEEALGSHGPVLFGDGKASDSALMHHPGAV